MAVRSRICEVGKLRYSDDEQSVMVKDGSEGDEVEVQIDRSSLGIRDLFAGQRPRASLTEW